MLRRRLVLILLNAIAASADECAKALRRKPRKQPTPKPSWYEDTPAKR